MNKRKSILKFSDKVILFPFWLVSMLPLRVIYIFFSWPLYVLIFYVARYRRKVVFENLRNSFPEKNSNEIRRIAKGFYKHFCDYFLESIYVINMTQKEVQQRFQFKNIEVIKDLYDKDKNVILMTTHYGNWEWAIEMANIFPHDWSYAIYRPLTNKLFDRFFIYLRSKYGVTALPMQQVLRTIVERKRKNESFTMYTLSDQRPHWSDVDFWTEFLNQDTPVITGSEKLASKFDLAVVFFDMQKTKRGWYEIDIKLITDDAASTEKNFISKKYIELVEDMVKRQPEFYLWTHKRWKYKREA